MATGGSHDHRDLAHLEAPYTVPEHHPLGPEPTAGLRLDRAELSSRERLVGLVEEGDDPSSRAPVGAHPPCEEGDPAETRALQFAHRRVDAQRLGRQADRHLYPPP